MLFGQHAGHGLALAPVKILAHRLGVAALVFGRVRLHIQHHETRAQAFDLLLHGGADVVPAHHRAQAPRRGDGLQARNARADHQHARGRHGSGGGHEHGEHAGQGIGGDQHRLVSGNGGHGRERVHALRARDARHQLHRQEGDSGARPGHARHPGPSAARRSRSPSALAGTVPGPRRPLRDWRPDCEPAAPPRRFPAPLREPPGARLFRRIRNRENRHSQPAPGSISNSTPLLFKTEIAPGTIATRFSPGALSETIPTLMPILDSSNCHRSLTIAAPIASVRAETARPSAHSKSAVLKKNRSSCSAVSGASEP